MFLSILHRTILWELFRVFLLALLGITGILLMAGVVTEASRHGLGPAQILAIIPLIVPSTLPYTLPATTLFTTCVVYGRLAHDNEILAIRAAGVNVLKVMWPGIFLGLLMTGTTIGLFLDVIPTTKHLMRVQLLADIEDFLYGVLRQQNELRYPRFNYEIYVKRVNGRKLQDAVIFRRDPKTGKTDLEARASSAELSVDLDKGQLLVKMWQGKIHSTQGGDSTRADFAYNEWPVDLPPNLGQQEKFRDSDMTWLELIEAERARQAEVDQVDAEIALNSSLIALKKPIDDLPKNLAQLQIKRRHKSLERLYVEVQMHWRIVVGLGCLCFVLVGCPVGIWLGRSDYLSAFIACFLPVVVVYYPLLLCGNNLAKSGNFPILPCLWAANGLMFLASLVLHWRLLKH